MKKAYFLALLALAGGYWLLLSKPALYYGNSLDYKCFTLRGRGEIPASHQLALDRALERVSTSEFFSPETRFDVYIAGGQWELGFFAPFVSGYNARVSPINGGIFLAPADFEADQSLPSAKGAEPRALNKVIAAAAARKMVISKVKPLTYVFMSDWEVAGYGESISGGSGRFTPPDICESEAPEGSALRDYEYGLAVDLIMNVEKISFADLLNKNYSHEAIKRQLKQRYCGR